MKSILLSMVLLVSTSLMAATADVDTNGLTVEQKARLQLQVEQMKREQDKAQFVDNAKQYVELGEMIGKAFGSCAKELNVQVNEFIQTPAGMLTISIICWKTVGRDVIHFGFGFCFLVFGFMVWYRCAYLPVRVSSIEYGQGFWIFRAKNVKYNNWSNTNDRDIVLMTISMIALIGVSQVIMWS